MAFSSWIWLEAHQKWSSAGRCHWSSRLFILQKRENHNQAQLKQFIRSEVLSFTFPLKAWRSWPRANILWRPWSRAPCSHRWWSFHLRVSCSTWTYAIWVRTQGHSVNEVRGGSAWTPHSNDVETCHPSSNDHRLLLQLSQEDDRGHRVCFVSCRTVRKYRNQLSGKVQVIYFSTSKKWGKKGGWRGNKKQMIGSQSLFFSSSQWNQRQEGRFRWVSSAERRGGGGRDSLLSSGLSRLELGDKVFDCLFLEVRAHIAGEGPISVALVYGSTKTRTRPCFWPFSSYIRLVFCFGTRKHVTFESWVSAEVKPTRSSCCSSATGQSPAPSGPPGICCSRWRTFRQSVSSCWTALWTHPLTCRPGPTCRRNQTDSCQVIKLSHHHEER